MFSLGASLSKPLRRQGRGETGCQRGWKGLRRTLWVALAISVPVVLAGCQQAGMRGGPEAATSEPNKVHLKSEGLNPDELERLNRAFADRYVMRLSNACDLILRDNPNIDQCRQVREIRASGAMGVYDIVTDPDRYMQTLNLTVTVTLQWVAWGEEGRAEKVFGPRGRYVLEAAEAAHKEIQDIDARIFSPSEMAILDHLIREWRRLNPGVIRVAQARFTDFIDSPEESEAMRKEASGLFAEIEEARQTVEETRALAERGLYMAKRMPLLLAWRTEATFDEITATQAMARALDDFHTVAGVAAGLPATLDAQRQALGQDFDQRQGALDTTIKDVRETLAQAATLATETKSLLVELQKTMVTLENLMKQGDALASRYVPGPEAPSASGPAGSQAATSPGGPGGAAHPFDIQEYTAAIKEGSQAARDVNTALESSEKLLDSPAWALRISEVNAAADGRMRLASEQSHAFLESTFRRVYVALGALMVVLIVARVVSAWLLKRLKLNK